MSDRFIHLVSRDTAISLGLNRYFEPKLCANGHESERYVKGGKCVTCNYAEADRRAEKARIAAYQKEEERLSCIQFGESIHYITRKQASCASIAKYFPASECKNGHIAQRYTANGMCVECTNEKQQAEEWKQYKKDYFQSNKEAILKKAKERKEAIGDAFHARMRELYHKHKHKHKERDRLRRLADRDSQRIRRKKWAEANPEKIRESNLKRASNRRSAPGKHTLEDVYLIFSRQDGKCAECRKKLKQYPRSSFHVDHVMPVALGGSNEKENLQILCPECNMRKGPKDPFDWANQNGRLL